MTIIHDLEWNETLWCDGEEHLYTAYYGGMRFTVLDRLTGFGWRDVETGFKDEEGRFWLASGNMDIRNYPNLTIDSAIRFIKDKANTCVGE